MYRFQINDDAINDKHLYTKFDRYRRKFSIELRMNRYRLNRHMDGKLSTLGHAFIETFFFVFA